ncbi:hypothetical protein [Thioalkalivibrio sp. XN279]|uniref:hypothetical protein n=1 Tax=Thioalkalivibrio sp. XN279 TaxID=2714953 RepID=UPI00140DE4E6|nr:hypothetical protein [Thioalkalivibrio sp. XN279]NHA15091.1 hypothetical protein [Thioalkalivibrio sp. XN279]
MSCIQHTGRLAALAAILLLAACAQPTRVASTWHAEAPAEAPQGVLVVGVGRDLTNRRTFEDLLAGRLRAAGNQAWASSRHTDNTVPLQRETVAAAVTSTGAGLVVVTRLEHQDFAVTETGERESVKVQRRSETPLDFFRYNYEVVAAPTYLATEAAVSLSADVYSVSVGRLLYTIDVVIPPRDTRYEIMDEAARAIEKRLRRAKLVE